MTKLNVYKRVCLFFLLGVGTAIASHAQTFTTLVNFHGTNGQWPWFMSLVQGLDGNLYGTTADGGAKSVYCYSGCGTIFNITPSGTLTKLYTFCGQLSCTDGAEPIGGLVQARDGNLYGTTFGNDKGTIFKVTRSGTLTTLYTFCGQLNCTDGSGPESALFQATDGNLYGTTYDGGANSRGTIFKITTSGTFTTLYSFCTQNNCADGANPVGALIEGTNGSLYGTTNAGGVNSSGTVFRITREGMLTVLHRFAGDGAGPLGGLVQGSDGNFYGTTNGGGGHSVGSVFRIASDGKGTLLHSFNGRDGFSPVAGLIQATNGNFYGTTLGGGAHDLGTVFEITPAGALTTLYSFSGDDGVRPLWRAFSGHERCSVRNNP
jgi:uncharacterized repeat protein (TIGR03803 family)